MPANPSFDQIAATTLANYRKTLTDNVFKSTPFLDWLARKDRVRFLDGGAQIVEPLIHASNSTAKPYAGWDVLDITPQEGISAATFPWKQFAASVAINGIEEAVNSGTAAIVDLLEAKIMQAESSIVEVMSAMAFGDGANLFGSPNAKTWNGLGNLLGTGAVGGIDPAVAGNAFWTPVRIDAATDPDGAGAETATTNAVLNDDRKWATAFYSAAGGGSDSPDRIFTTQALYQAYEELLTPGLRFTSNDEADGRFQNVLFKGVPVFLDAFCPTGVTYFLNSKYLGLAVLKNKWLKHTPFKETPDVDGRWSNILSYGNFTIRNRAKHAVVFNQTVPA